MRYYASVWPVLRPHITDRPLVLKRFPDGVEGPVFYQQNAGAKVPPGVRVENLSTSEGERPRIIGGDLLTEKCNMSGHAGCFSDFGDIRRRLYAEARDAAGDDVAQQVTIVAGDFEHEAVTVK